MGFQLFSSVSGRVLAFVWFCLAAAMPTLRAQTSPVALTVTADHSPVVPGETVDFTFTVTNLSSAPLPGRGVTVNWTVPNSVAGATPGMAVSRPYLQVAAFQSYSFHQAYTVDPATALEGSTVGLAASVFLDSASAASATASAGTVVNSAPTLNLALEDDARGAVAPGGTVVYTVTTTNRGTVAVASPVLSAAVPAGTVFVSADAGGTLAGGAVQWALGTLAPGATIIRSLTVQAGGTSGVILAQAAAVDQADSANQSAATLTTLVSTGAFLGLTVTPDHSPVQPGEAVDFTFTVSNLGTAAFTGRGVTVEWNVPNFVSGATPGEIDSQTYLQLAPGQSYSFHKSFVAAAAVADGSGMRVEASAYLLDGDRFGADAVADAVVDTVPTLSLELTDDAAGGAVPGQVVSYTLTATNRGSSAVANAVLNAPVPAGTVLAAISADGTLANGQVSWAIGALGAGDSAVRTFGVQVEAGTGGTILARAQAMDEGNPLNVAAAALATVVPATPLLGLTVTADRVTAIPGDTINYTFTVSNPGPAAFTGRGVVVEWNVPNFVSGATPGEIDTNSYLSVAAGGMLSFTRAYTVASPPDGSILRLEASAYLIDGSRFGVDETAQVVVERARTHPAFFDGEAPLGSGVDYLRLPNGNIFGYYSYLSDQNYLYHFDLGYEYVFDAADGRNGIYLYDFASQSYFYTSPTFAFPYLYDFSLNSVVYYYPDPSNPGRYNTDGYRFFYVFNTGQIIVK